MLRRAARLRKEYLYRKANEEKEKSAKAKRRAIREAIEEEKAVPSDLRAETHILKNKQNLDDIQTTETTTHIDDEYAFAGIRPPRVMITTAREPSSRLAQFAKELRLVIPGSQRINRGSYVIADLVQLCRSHDVTDILIIHEHRGEPDGLIVSHFPYGPTAYFSMRDVVLRHDLPVKPPNMSEVAPHLIFHNFTSRLGIRVSNILKYLFPPANQAAQRVMAFVNQGDLIQFRHYTWAEAAHNGDSMADTEADGGHRRDKKDIELTEVGPRFTLRLYRIELGTAECKSVETEWTLRPYFNKQRAALT